MIDFQTAVQVGVFAALNGAVTVTNLADVWQNAPEDTQPDEKGLVIVGPISLDAADTKDGGFEKATLAIFTYVRQPDITTLYALNSAVRSALQGQTLTAPGAELGPPVFLGADPNMMEDGVTYFDQLRFELYVQEA